MSALARAYLSLGRPDAARAVLSPFWRTQELEARDEAAIIKQFGKVLSSADHRFRMERMLYAERPNSAQRVAALAGAKQLADAWSAVLSGNKNARKLLDAVPAAQRSAGYLFAEAKYLRRAEKCSDAAAVMMKAPNDKVSLVDPDEWWTERRVLSRELVDHGDIKTAYRLAAGHSAEQTANVVDAEFHAGWYALRELNDPRAAASHFARIAAVADGPLSRSRAYYWLGRAAEAGGPGSADAYYRKAAVFGTAFYGQLAAARLGSTRDIAELSFAERGRPPEFRNARGGARHSPSRSRRLRPAARSSIAISPGRWSARGSSPCSQTWRRNRAIISWRCGSAKSRGNTA